MANVNLGTSSSAKEYAKKAAIGAGVSLAAGAAGLLLESYREAKKINAARQSAAQGAANTREIIDNHVLSSKPSIEYYSSNLIEKRRVVLELIKLCSNTYGVSYDEKNLKIIINWINNGKEEKVDSIFENLLRDARKIILEDRAEAKKRLKEQEAEIRRKAKKTKKIIIICVIAIILSPFVTIGLGQLILYISSSDPLENYPLSP
jgi:hypothetical protein